MYIELNQKKYQIDNNINGGFEKKINQLRKKNHIQIDITIYVTDENLDDFVFFEKLNNLPNNIYLTNNFYWWIFENIKLEDKQIKEDYIYKPKAKEKKFKIHLIFNYEKIHGTNNRTSYDRELSIKKFL